MVACSCRANRDLPFLRGGIRGCRHCSRAVERLLIFRRCEKRGSLGQWIISAGILLAAVRFSCATTRSRHGASRIQRTALFLQLGFDNFLHYTWKKRLLSSTETSLIFGSSWAEMARGVANAQRISFTQRRKELSECNFKLDDETSQLHNVIYSLWYAVFFFFFFFNLKRQIARITCCAVWEYLVSSSSS